MNEIVKDYYLSHHGILGQKWGKQNGPPYPLGASDHSAREKKMGWRKSLDKTNSTKHTKSNSEADARERKGLTDKQKRAIKIGVAAAATALAAYGTYRLVKSGKLDKQIAVGKDYINSLLGKKVGDTEFRQQKYSDFVGENSFDPFKGVDFNNLKFKAGETKSSTATQFVNGIKKLTKPESVAERIKNTNPLLLKDNNELGKHNCVFCGIASYLRGQGYDVTAKGSIDRNDTIKIAEKCFKNPKIISGTATKFGRSRNDAAEMLLNKFGQNAEGLVRIQWHNSKTNAPGAGHCFNWKIQNGIVQFFDAQSNRDDSVVSKAYWRKGWIDPEGLLDLVRLDGCEINKDAIFEFVENNTR